jgi:repressor LexA
MPNELTDVQREVWLFLNERSESGEPSPTYREICEHFAYASPRAAFDHVLALEKKGYVTRGKGARNLRLVRKIAGIPLLSRIPAGFAEEAALTTTDVRFNVDYDFHGIRDRSRAFALRVAGDSMIGRHIFDGDIVVLDNPADVRDGDIVAALIDNQSILKTLVRKGGEVWLRAENPDYPDLIPLLGLQVQGVVRSVIRRMGRG